VSFLSLFFELHRDLPREGPGDDASTARALALVAPYLPQLAEILDIGCGPGAQTMVLARETAATITAVDVHAPFLRELERRAAAAGVSDRIRTLQASMQALPIARSSFDAIWSEGAIWLIGFAAGLAAWRPLLRTRGVAVVSELTWLVAEPDARERAFWSRAYPAMQSDEANRAAIGAEGYDLLGTFTLPHESWFTEYLDPLERRAAAMAARHAGNAEAVAWLTAECEEVEIARRFRGFGYVFYAMRARA
jgi:SAM-dependent methyltransferase